MVVLVLLKIKHLLPEAKGLVVKMKSGSIAVKDVNIEISNIIEKIFDFLLTNR